MHFFLEMHLNAFYDAVMFTRPNGDAVLHFKVYDGYGHCIETFTGTMQEFQQRAPLLTLQHAPAPSRDERPRLN